MEAVKAYKAAEARWEENYARLALLDPCVRCEGAVCEGVCLSCGKAIAVEEAVDDAQISLF